MKHHVLVSLAFPKGYVVLDDDVIHVGRDRDCLVQLLGEEVSRHHALLLREMGHFSIQDAGSSNGTLVNDEPVPSGKPHVLVPGDRVQVGPHVLTFVVHEGTRDELARRFDPGHKQTNRVAPVARSRVQLAGHFVGHELLEVCQLVELNRHSGELSITASGFRGSIRFAEGTIVDAHCGISQGEAAARELLGFHEGDYSFHASPAPLAGPLRLRASGLLMDVVREQDEAKRKKDAASVPEGFTDEVPTAPRAPTAPRPTTVLPRTPGPRPTTAMPRTPTSMPRPTTSMPRTPTTSVPRPTTSMPRTPTGSMPRPPATPSTPSAPRPTPSRTAPVAKPGTPPTEPR